MNKRFLGALPLALILLVASCDTPLEESPAVEETEFVSEAAPIGGDGSAADKAYSLGNVSPFGRADLDGWIVTLTDVDLGGGTALYEYQVRVPGEGSGTFIYSIPECAVYQSATPAPDAADASTLEWELESGESVIQITFGGPDAGRPGVVQIAAEHSESVAEGLSIGPCNGVNVIAGTVFLNDTSDELVPPNDDQDPGEPGIGNVEVRIQEFVDGVWVFDDSPAQLTSDEEGSFGTYLFEVLGPPVDAFPDQYRVVVTTTSTLAGAINESLFGGLIEVSCDDDCPDIETDLVAKEFNFETRENLDFGFEVDLEEAIAAFRSGDAESDGRPRKYWLTQFRQKDSWRYPLEYTKSELLDILNCSNPGYDPPGPIECIFDPAGNPNDFSGDVDDLVASIFPIDGGRRDFNKARQLLRKISPPRNENDDDDDGDDDDDRGRDDGDDDDGDGPRRGNPDREYEFLVKVLRQEAFVSLLNYTVGRGACTSELNGNQCFAFDDGLTRIFIQNALVVLKETELFGKAGSSKVRNNSELLGEMNN